MANLENNDDFQVLNKPRMERRDSVTYPSRVLSDDGAFSPMNLLSKTSVSEIDPEGIIARGLQVERQSQKQHERKSKSLTATGSVLDGWKKLHEAKNSVFNGIERLFEPTSTLKGSISAVVAGKHNKKRSAENFKREENPGPSGNHRGTPVIPWRKQDIKQTTIAEERRKLFESFDMTSIEPPDTPRVSELTLRKLAKKNKRRKKENKGFRSKESVSSSMGVKINKETIKIPYSNVPAKVNTRWDKMDELQQGLKLKSQSISVEKEGKAKRLLVATDKSPGINQAKIDGEKSLPPLPVKKQESASDNKTKKLVKNYPASETVKHTTDKLPLTIAPRYNRKKALGLLNEVKIVKPRSDVGETESVSSNRLFGTIPAHQKGKYESKAVTGNSLRSTFFNLQRINNGGTAPVSTVNNKRTNSNGQLIVGRYSANILGTPVIGPVKRDAPILTTIQPPPSPFLASKISIQSQMNEIPVNGEKIIIGKVKGTKNAQKPGNVQPKKVIQRAKKTPVPEPPKPTQGQAPAKVVPTLGPLPNKYNNIYIGPYSGSESEGENPSLKRKR